MFWIYAVEMSFAKATNNDFSIERKEILWKGQQYIRGVGGTI